MIRLYLDNAATSFPKPSVVHEAVADYMLRVGASPGRGFYTESREGARIIRRTRESINELIRGEDPDHVVFTLNTSDALNLAIKGVVRQRRLTAPERPIHLIATALDHNSVLRPVRALQADAAAGIGPPVEVTILPGDPRTGRIDAEDVSRTITRNTALVAVNHASNVAGTIQPIAEVGAVCRSRGIPFLVDAAQSLGHVPVDVVDMSIDLLAFPGHKGLLGPQGTGGLYVRPGTLLATWREGGTGSLSELDTHPDAMPQKLEAGSHNTAGIAGLGAAVSWILERGIDAMRAHELGLSRVFLDLLRDQGLGEDGALGLRLLGPERPEDRVAVFSFVHRSIAPAEFAAILEGEFGILARSGLTCAPLAHERFGTHPDAGGRGVFRVSFGPFVTSEDVRRTAGAIAEVARSAAGVS